MDHKPTVADDGFPRTGSIKPPAAWSAPAWRGSTSGRSRRGLLGAGLVEVPPVPYRDPAKAVLENPVVAERRRFCRCGEPVGRGRGGRPGRTEGFCPRCGAAFSFLPKLRAGELVGGQYEVLGCLAHGGLGWIYLARDRNVNDRWVVLKGLLDTDDPAADAVAAAEKAFLSEVEHPNIVRIYNFVQHPEPRTFAMVGYIVMEYVGGRSLKDVLLEHRDAHGQDTALPLSQAIAYALEVLRAMGYLHALGLLYCDLKPDNAIQAEEQLKLIDLGGVRRREDFTSAIYGTVGYQAPEIAGLGPSVASDLFTVGRTLAVLSFPFRHFTTTYVADLPPREQIDVLREHESYDRFLRRATARDPFARFTDAGEMAEQLTGVLREVLSAQDEEPRTAPSTLFGPERRTVTGELSARRAVRALPVPLIAAAGGGAPTAAPAGDDDPVAVLAALAAADGSDLPAELLLRRALAHIDLGGRDEAAALLARLTDDWRADWCLAMAALAADDAEEARTRFDALYSLLPGELAPKLGLAFACELLGDLDAAQRHYLAVWRTGRSHVSAAFGLSRVRLAAGDRPGAVASLDSVPPVSSHRQAAGMAAVRALVLHRSPAHLAEDDLLDAGRRLDRLRLDAERHGGLAVDVLGAALGWVLAGHSSTDRLLGHPLTERGLRTGLERTYRTLARLCDDTPERHRLITRANAVRPRTLL